MYQGHSASHKLPWKCCRLLALSARQPSCFSAHLPTLLCPGQSPTSGHLLQGLSAAPVPSKQERDRPVPSAHLQTSQSSLHKALSPACGLAAARSCFAFHRLFSPREVIREFSNSCTSLRRTFMLYVRLPTWVHSWFSLLAFSLRSVCLCLPSPPAALARSLGASRTPWCLLHQVRVSKTALSLVVVAGNGDEKGRGACRTPLPRLAARGVQRGRGRALSHPERCRAAACSCLLAPRPLRRRGRCLTGTALVPTSSQAQVPWYAAVGDGRTRVRAVSCRGLAPAARRSRSSASGSGAPSRQRGVPGAELRNPKSGLRPCAREATCLALPAAGGEHAAGSLAECRGVIPPVNSPVGLFCLFCG